MVTQDINLKSRLMTKLRKLKVKRKKLLDFLLLILAAFMFYISSILIKNIESKWDLERKREFQEIISVHLTGQGVR